MVSRKSQITRYLWAHDYRRLMEGWRKIYRKAELRMTAYGKASGYPLYFLETKKPLPKAPSIFFSAGIHGDEPAAPIALLEWTRRHPNIARRLNLLLFPCLNPWGLVHNNRLDENGYDLNRTYQDDSILQTVAHRRILAKRRFDVALTLHEDYDAHGVYVYEVQRKKPYFAEKILQAASRHLPVETRARVDKRKIARGIIRRNLGLHTMPNRPEALHLFFFHVDRAYTVESPSEYFLDDRVEALIAALNACVKLCLNEYQGKNE